MNKNFLVVLITVVCMLASASSAFAVDDAVLAEVSTKANNANVKADEAKGGLVNEISNRVSADASLQSQIDNIQQTSGTVGPQGEQGPVGPQGPQGEVGPQGPQGIQGFIGQMGIEGPQGLQGLQGEQGPRGIQGEKGDDGVAGENGSPGAPGAPGIPGLHGEVGPQGPAGADGKDGGSGVQEVSFRYVGGSEQYDTPAGNTWHSLNSKGVWITKQSNDSVLKVSLSERWRSSYVNGLMYGIYVDGTFAGWLGTEYDAQDYYSGANVRINFTAIAPTAGPFIYTGDHFVEIRVKTVGVNHALGWISFSQSYLEVTEIIGN